MDLHTYLKQAGLTQQEVAEAIGVSQSLINQWVHGVKPRPDRCVQIERYTEGRVSRIDLRPDDWRDTWPELTWPAAWQGWGSDQAVPRAALRGGGGGPALCAASA